MTLGRTIKRTCAIAAASAATLAFSGTTTSATKHDVEEHGHVKLLHVQIDFEFENDQLVTADLTGYARCIDHRAGRGKSWRAHHHSIHTGNAGDALFDAGHLVIPVHPLGPPWRTDCAGIASQLEMGPISLLPPPPPPPSNDD